MSPNNYASTETEYRNMKAMLNLTRVNNIVSLLGGVIIQLKDI